MGGRLLGAPVAVMVAGGCSAAGAGYPVSAAGGYWNSARLAGAQPLYGGSRVVRLPGQTPSAHAAAGALRVGALFEHDASGGHYCTASVVASPGENLLITAAHCINGGG